MRRARAALVAAAALALLPAQAPPPPPTFGLPQTVTQGALAIGVAPPGTRQLTLDGKPVALAADGRFAIGLDRDQSPAAMLAAELADGSYVRRALTVVPRAWRVEHIDVARRPAVPDEAYRLLRERELARIAAARAGPSLSAGWRQRFAWPARGRISGRFGAQRIYRGEPAAYHSGVDVAAGRGAPVTAPADGMVVLAGPPAFSLEGNLVIIDHGAGLNSAFLHLASSNVRVGQAVKQGQLIGTVGATGRATGPHLHWSVKWNDARLDPELLAGAMPAK